MRDAFASIFGEDGAVAAQYLITLLVVLVLIGVVVWLVRRYSRGGKGFAPRGRLPRLAVVDSLSVDSRRQLILVRRDNIEHLVLVGGPTDIVVEPSITRTRVAQRPAQAPAATRPAAAQAAAASPPQPPPLPLPEAESEPRIPRATHGKAQRQQSRPAENPVPFSPRRINAQPRPVARPPRREEARLAPPTREPEEPPKPAPAEPAQQPVSSPSPPRPVAAQPMPAEPDPAPAEPTPPPPAPRKKQQAESPFAPKAGSPAPPASPFAPDAAPPARTNPARAQIVQEEPNRPPPPAAAAENNEDGTTSVSALEEDMARLLGQISTERSA